MHRVRIRPRSIGPRQQCANSVPLQSRLRYLQADFLNLQRNAAREKEQARDYAISRFASDLLETVDVLSMALKSTPKTFTTPPLEPSDPSSPSDAPVENTADVHLREL